MNYNPYTETPHKKRSRVLKDNIYWIIPIAILAFMLLLLVVADTI